MEPFAHWKDLPQIQLPDMERKLFYGKDIMRVRNEIHPQERMLLVLSGAWRGKNVSGGRRYGLLFLQCGAYGHQYGGYASGGTGCVYPHPGGHPEIKRRSPCSILIRKQRQPESLDKKDAGCLIF